MAALTYQDQNVMTSNQYQDVSCVVDYGMAREYFSEGVAHYKAHDILGAIAAYRSAMACAPGYKEAQQRLEYAIKEYTDIQAEISQARKHLEVHPDAIQVRFRLAQRLQIVGQPQAAEKEFDIVIKTDESGNWRKSAQKMLRKHPQFHLTKVTASP